MTKGRIYAIISAICYLVFAAGGIIVGGYMINGMYDIMNGPQESGTGDVAALMLLTAILAFAYASPAIIAFILKFVNIFTRGKAAAIISMIFGIIYILIHGGMFLSSLPGLAGSGLPDLLLTLLIVGGPFAISVAALVTNIKSIKICASACDLHVHSHFSDGTLSPTDIIAEAERIGLASVALTDHNTTAGLDEFVRAAENTSVEAIAGIEFSTEYRERELHILGLFIEPAHYREINLMLAKMHELKDESNRTLINGLRAIGIDITYGEVHSTTKGHINRAHIASVLFEKGYASSVKDAFSRYLDVKAGIYKPPKRPNAFETVEYIEAIGAVSVLAHPFLSFDNTKDIEEFVAEAKCHGLTALETRYSTYSEQQQLSAMAIAARYSLLESGGSDYHGTKKPHISLGTGQGDLYVPGDVMTALKNKALQNKEKLNG